MAKKPSTKSGGTKTKGGLSAADHRKRSEEHYAKARLHSAHADLMDAKNPPKGKDKPRPY